MGKTAIILTGQGSHKVGMAKELYQVDTKATEILDQEQSAGDFTLLETMITDEAGKIGEKEN
ncbi:malonyl CoA-acyl carrier protein transacylase, partial [Staphylococcus condimenti]